MQNKPKKKLNKSKKMLLFIIAIVIVLGGLSYFYLSNQEVAAEITYQTGKVKHGDLILSLDNSGVIQYIDQSEITADVSGTISQLYIQEDSKVNAGDPILTIDDSDMQIQLEQAYSDLKIAELQLADLLQTTVDKINQVSIDKLSVITAPINGVVNYNLEEGASVTTNTQLMSITDNKKINFVVGIITNDVKLVKVGQTVDIRLDDFTGSVAGTVDKISNTSHSDGYTMVNDVWVSVTNPGMLNIGMEGTAEIKTASGSIIRDGQFAEVEDVKVYPSVTGTIEKIYVDNGQFVSKGTTLAKIDNTALINQIETQKLQIENTRLKIKQLENDRNNLIVKTNYTGTINDLYVVPNQTISANTKIATIVSNELIANIEIDEVDIGKIHLGQEATLSITALPDEQISGTVSYISKTGTVKDGITSYEVYISIPKNEKIKAGMSVDASILLAKAENTLMVPATSVIDVKDEKAVRVLVGDQITVKKVETGISNDTMTEIKSGIELTDEVITSITDPSSGSATPARSTSGSPLPIPGFGGSGGGGSGR